MARTDSHGFLRDASGNFTTINDPSAVAGSFPYGINNAGCSGQHGFQLDVTGSFTAMTIFAQGDIQRSHRHRLAAQSPPLPLAKRNPLRAAA